MSFRKRLLVSTLVALSVPLAVACIAEETPTPPATGGAGGAGGAGGSGGSTAGAGNGGTAGTGGSTGGTGGAGGSAGAATGGTGGGAGSGAGAGGSGAGAGGAGAGGAGMAGSAGTAGAAGAMGGMSGSAGAAGAGGASGSGAAGAAGMAGSGGSAGGGAFTLTSPAFENVEGCSDETRAPCERFPDENISFMNSPNNSPELTWTGAPAGTMSFVMVLQDLSNGQAHWVLWNIPSDTTMLAANVDKNDATPAVPAGSQQCNNFGAGDGYFGPGSECNVYEFVVFALSIADFSPTMDTNAGNVRTQLLALEDQGQILGTAYLRGRSNFEMDCPPP